jgi:hypothetical protein
MNKLDRVLAVIQHQADREKRMLASMKEREIRLKHLSISLAALEYSEPASEYARQVFKNRESVTEQLALLQGGIAQTARKAESAKRSVDIVKKRIKTSRQKYEEDRNNNAITDLFVLKSQSV